MVRVEVGQTLCDLPVSGWATMRQTTVARLEVAARTTRECGHLEALGATFDAIATRLRARWRLDGPALLPYPAFASASGAGDH